MKRFGDITTVSAIAHDIIDNGALPEHPTIEVLPALAAIGRSWEKNSDAAKRLRDRMAGDEYWDEDDRFCPNAVRRVIPECDVDCYETECLLKSLNVALAYEDDDEKFTVDADPDSAEHYRFAFLGDPVEDSDMGYYPKPLVPLAWTTIGLMALGDKDWNASVGKDDVREALSGRDGYNRFVPVPYLD